MRGDKRRNHVRVSKDEAALRSLIKLEPSVLCHPKLIRSWPSWIPSIFMAHQLDVRWLDPFISQQCVESNHCQTIMS